MLIAIGNTLADLAVVVALMAATAYSSQRQQQNEQLAKGLWVLRRLEVHENQHARSSIRYP